jgi:hypothetical protein
MGNDRPEQELHVSDLDNNIVNCEIGKGDFRCDNLHHLTLRLVTISKESVHGILGCCLGSPADLLSAMA